MFLGVDSREKGADTTTTTITPGGKGKDPKGKGFSGKAPQEKDIDEVYGKLPVPGRNGPPEKRPRSPDRNGPQEKGKGPLVIKPKGSKDSKGPLVMKPRGSKDSYVPREKGPERESKGKGSKDSKGKGSKDSEGRAKGSKDSKGRAKGSKDGKESGDLRPFNTMDSEDDSRGGKPGMYLDDDSMDRPW